MKYRRIDTMTIDTGPLRARKRATYLKNALTFKEMIPDDDVLELCLKAMTRSAKTRMYESLIRLQKSKRMPELLPRDRAAVTKFLDLFRMVYHNEQGHVMLYQKICSELDTICRDQESLQADDLESRLEKVCSLFEVDDAGKEILFFIYLYNSDSIVERLFDEFCNFLNVKTGFYSAPSVQPIAIILGLTPNNVARALSNTSPLVQSGLLDSNRSVAPEVHKYLEGYHQGALFTGYFTEFTGRSVPIDAHTINPTHWEVIVSLILNKPEARGINILLYGKAGTGKTEFCHSLGKHLNMAVYEIKNFNEEAERKENRVMFRFRALLACQRSINRQNSIILVDEADAMLNADSSLSMSLAETEKGQVNKIMDDSQSVIIWVTNRFSDIDESTRRRFDYSVRFQEFDCSQRKAIWLSTLRKYGEPEFFSNEELERLAADYDISAGGIDVAVRHAVELIGRGERKETVMGIMKEIINAHRKIIQCDRNLDTEKTVSVQYSLEGLNVKADLDETMGLIKKFNHYWQVSPEAMIVRNINILLYGPPGSGKTEFAKFVARTMKRTLLIKRASDLLNCYIGETEKSIKAAFKEAERQQAILFIDEADSLFSSRDNAIRSWEISQVNELLTHMETFKGMLICSTNFKKILDNAALRRFTIKLEFDYLKPQGNVIFYERMLSPLVDNALSPEETEQVQSIPLLTPGDFKTVFQRHAFFPKEGLPHGKLITALREEVSMKNDKSNRKMGF